MWNSSQDSTAIALKSKQYINEAQNKCFVPTGSLQCEMVHTISDSRPCIKTIINKTQKWTYCFKLCCSSGWHDSGVPRGQALRQAHLQTDKEPQIKPHGCVYFNSTTSISLLKAILPTLNNAFSKPPWGGDGMLRDLVGISMRIKVKVILTLH